MSSALLIIFLTIKFATDAEFVIYIFAKLWVPGRTRALRSELWWTTSFVSGPLFLFGVLFQAIMDSSAWDLLFLVFEALQWWFLVVKDKDRDDRWKKRRKKAMSKVKEASGRLVVVPIPAPA
jgi:hypothetical protein